MTTSALARRTQLLPHDHPRAFLVLAAMAWVLISYFFKIGTEFDGQYLVVLVTILFPVCGLVLYWGLRPLKKLNPMDLIRSPS